MNKNVLTLALCAFCFGLGFGFNNVAFSDNPAGLKIGYVNVAKLTEKSKALKAADDAKIKATNDMLKWYDTASADIQKQQTKEAKDALIKKYEAQLDSKKKAIADNYLKKVSEVDKQMDSVITQKAKDMGYNLVFKKEALLFGGDDITSSVLPLVK